MSWSEKLKDKFPKEEREEKKMTCDPTSTLFLSKEETWQFECAVREDLKSLGERCLSKLGIASRG